MILYLTSNSDSRPGDVLSITGRSNTPPPLPDPVVDSTMRIPILAHGPLQREDLSPAAYIIQLLPSILMLWVKI